MNPVDRELNRTALLLRDAAKVERETGKGGHTLEVLEEVLGTMRSGDRRRFATELAAYLARALVAAISRGRGRA